MRPVELIPNEVEVLASLLSEMPDASYEDFSAYSIAVYVAYIQCRNAGYSTDADALLQLALGPKEARAKPALVSGEEPPNQTPALSQTHR